jgi:DNA polymerase IV
MWTLCRDCVRLDPSMTETCADCGSTRLVRHAELAGLTIAHVDCDAFYAAVEKRDDPSLAEKPVIVGHPGGRGVVTTACYVARKFGPRSAMPMFKAMEMCPHAVVIPPNMAKYKVVSRDIRAIFAEISDCIEPVSLDEAYLDFSLEHRIGDDAPARALADAAGRIEREIGITVSIGLSYNKFLAKLASDREKPRGFSVLGRAEAHGFLAGLPISRIHGVGKATQRRMEALGFTTIADLQRLPEGQIVGMFGKFGYRLAEFVHGEDGRKVTPDRETKSISAETTFSRDTGNLETLIETVRPMCQRVAERLVRSELAGRTVVLKLKTTDFRVLTRSIQLRSPTQRADLLFEQAKTLLAREANRTTYRLIGVGVSELVSAQEADPPDLFSI